MELGRLFSTFEILFFVISAVFFSGAFGKSISLRDTCGQEFVESVWEAKEAYFNLYPNKKDEIKDQLEETTGLDVDDKEQMHKLACQLEGAESVAEVAAILKISEMMFSPAYNILKEKVKAVGGIQGIKQAAALERAIFSDLDLMNFPNFPLRISFDAAFHKIKTLVDVFGADFIHLIILEEDVPVLESDDDIQQLAKAFTDATSLENFAEIVGWPYDRVEQALLPYTDPFENGRYVEALMFNLRWDLLMRNLYKAGFWDLE